METEIHAPTDRVCEQCDRSETWDDEGDRWIVDGEPGRLYCIHQWDITGDFAPIKLE
jgi:hypothetical protein